MNPPPLVDEVWRVIRERKENAKREASRAQLQRPVSATPKAQDEGQPEKATSLCEILDQARVRAEEKLRAAQEESRHMQDDDDDSKGEMVVHRDDIPKIEAMTRLLNESFDREVSRSIAIESEQREIEESLAKARERRGMKPPTPVDNSARLMSEFLKKRGAGLDRETQLILREDLWNGMWDEVIYNKAYDHRDRAAVGMVIEGLREQAMADNPKIAGAVWGILFVAVLLGAAILESDLGVFWGGTLLVALLWGAQACICRLAKRGRAPVPPHLVAYLMANAQELKRAIDRGDVKRLSLHAQIEYDTQREIYQYMRGLEK